MQSVSPFGDPVRLLICSSNGRHRMTGRDNFGAEHILSGWNGAPQASSSKNNRGLLVASTYQIHECQLRSSYVIN